MHCVDTHVRAGVSARDQLCSRHNVGSTHPFRASGRAMAGGSGVPAAMVDREAPDALPAPPQHPPLRAAVAFPAPPQQPPAEEPAPAPAPAAPVEEEEVLQQPLVTVPGAVWGASLANVLNAFRMGNMPVHLRYARRAVSSVMHKANAVYGVQTDLQLHHGKSNKQPSQGRHTQALAPYTVHHVRTRPAGEVWTVLIGPHTHRHMLPSKALSTCQDSGEGVACSSAYAFMVHLHVGGEGDGDGEMGRVRKTGENRWRSPKNESQ